MKKLLLLLLSFITGATFSYSQQLSKDDQQAIIALIDQYQQARERMDTSLLKSILTEDIDQLVSNGEWRNGISEAVTGMMKSSATNAGTRTLTVDKTKMLGNNSAIADCRYEIRNADGSVRRMWSSFTLVKQKKAWKISAIRNMLPATGS